MTFDKNLKNIVPFPPNDQGFKPQENVFHSIRLHLTHGFMWEKEVWGNQPSDGDDIALTRWIEDNSYYV